jgi:hypothetical protein
MNIYLLKRIGRTMYDQTYGFVIRAHNEEQARSIACDAMAGQIGDEARTWMLPQLSTCTVIGSAFGDDRAEIILQDFRAG